MPNKWWVLKTTIEKAISYPFLWIIRGKFEIQITAFNCLDTYTRDEREKSQDYVYE